MLRHSQRWGWAATAIVLTSVIVVLGVPTVRRQVLRATGWALVVKTPPVQSADVIVVAVDADGAGTLEAADLIQRGVASHTAVFADPPDSVDNEFIRRGLPYEDRAAVSIRQLKSLGVDSVEQIPRSASGSEDESRVLPDWCDKRHYRSIVLVANSDHSQRLQRMLQRSMKGHQTTVIVYPSRYSKFDPERWWETRDGVRTEIIESEKLLLDLVRHPIS